MFKCECGRPAHFWITNDNTATVRSANVTQWAACIRHVAKALRDSGAYAPGRVVGLKAYVHREANTRE